MQPMLPFGFSMHEREEWLDHIATDSRIPIIAWRVAAFIQHHVRQTRIVDIGRAAQCAFFSQTASHGLVLGDQIAR